MMTNVTIPLPEKIQNYIRRIERENFNLWMFIAEHDLREEAEDFLLTGRNSIPAFESWEELPF